MRAHGGGECKEGDAPEDMRRPGAAAPRSDRRAGLQGLQVGRHGMPFGSTQTLGLGLHDHAVGPQIAAKTLELRLHIIRLCPRQAGKPAWPSAVRRGRPRRPSHPAQGHRPHSGSGPARTKAADTGLPLAVPWPRSSRPGRPRPRHQQRPTSTRPCCQLRHGVCARKSFSCAMVYWRRPPARAPPGGLRPPSPWQDAQRWHPRDAPPSPYSAPAGRPVRAARAAAREHQGRGFDGQGGLPSTQAEPS